MTRSPFLTLNNGVQMPALGLGVFQSPPDETADAVETSASRRMGNPDDVAAAAAFLLGPESSFVTGADLLIGGGVIAALRADGWALSG